MHTRHGQAELWLLLLGLDCFQRGLELCLQHRSQVYCLVGFSIDADWLLRGGQAPRVLAGTHEMWCTTPHFAATHSPAAEKLLRAKGTT